MGGGYATIRIAFVEGVPGPASASRFTISTPRAVKALPALQATASAPSLPQTAHAFPDEADEPPRLLSSNVRPPSEQDAKCNAEAHWQDCECPQPRVQTGQSAKHQRLLKKQGKEQEVFQPLELDGAGLVGQVAGIGLVYVERTGPLGGKLQLEESGRRQRWEGYGWRYRRRWPRLPMVAMVSMFRPALCVGIGIPCEGRTKVMTACLDTQGHRPWRGLERVAPGGRRRCGTWLADGLCTVDGRGGHGPRREAWADRVQCPARRGIAKGL